MLWTQKKNPQLLLQLTTWRVVSSGGKMVSIHLHQKLWTFLFQHCLNLFKFKLVENMVLENFQLLLMIFAGSQFPWELTILIVRAFLGRLYLLSLKLYHDRSDHFTDSLTKVIMKFK